MNISEKTIFYKKLETNSENYMDKSDSNITIYRNALVLNSYLNQATVYSTQA